MTTTADVNAFVKSTVDSFLGLFQKTECAQPVTGPSAVIHLSILSNNYAFLKLFLLMSSDNILDMKVGNQNCSEICKERRL